MGLISTSVIPEKILRDLDRATRPPAIRPETVRDSIMYNAGMRKAFELLCTKLSVPIPDGKLPEE